MTGPLFWCCLVTDRNPTPAQRISAAVESARRNLGYVPAVVHCHPATAAETTTPLGMELVVDPAISNRAEFRFVREPRPGQHHHLRLSGRAREISR